MNEEIESRPSEIDGCLAMALDRIRALETMTIMHGATLSGKPAEAAQSLPPVIQQRGDDVNHHAIIFKGGYVISTTARHAAEARDKAVERMLDTIDCVPPVLCVQRMS